MSSAHGGKANGGHHCTAHGCPSLSRSPNTLLRSIPTCPCAESSRKRYSSYCPSMANAHILLREARVVRTVFQRHMQSVEDFPFPPNGRYLPQMVPQSQPCPPHHNVSVHLIGPSSPTWKWRVFSERARRPSVHVDRQRGGWPSHEPWRPDGPGCCKTAPRPHDQPADKQC